MGQLGASGQGGGRRCGGCWEIREENDHGMVILFHFYIVVAKHNEVRYKTSCPC